MKIKLFCCAGKCQNWIRTDKSTLAEAYKAGWRITGYRPGGQGSVMGWDGYAECPDRHPTVERVTVADIRAALRGLPGDLVMVVGGQFDTGRLIVGARKARNRDA